ncbi:hypothetical protein [Spirosoma areae]
MKKTFTEINAPGEFTAPGGGKTTVVNTGMTPVILTDKETLEAASGLPHRTRRAVLIALYGLLPGESKSLATGTYNLDSQAGNGATVVVVSEIK